MRWSVTVARLRLMRQRRAAGYPALAFEDDLATVRAGPRVIRLDSPSGPAVPGEEMSMTWNRAHAIGDAHTTLVARRLATEQAERRRAEPPPAAGGGPEAAEAEGTLADTLDGGEEIPSRDT